MQFLDYLLSHAGGDKDAATVGQNSISVKTVVLLEVMALLQMVHRFCGMRPLHLAHTHLHSHLLLQYIMQHCLHSWICCCFGLD